MWSRAMRRMRRARRRSGSSGRACYATSLTHAMATTATPTATPPMVVKRPKAAAGRRTQVTKIRAGVVKMDPQDVCALQHDNPSQLLVATILSAQSTDKRVDEVTPGLNAK